MESYVEGKENIVFMTDYAIQPNNLMVEFMQWLNEKRCKFYWIDHHITAIENLKKFDIPGFQSSAKAGCMNTWYEIMKTTDGIPTPPKVIQLASDYDVWNKKSKFSWDEQLYPLNYFISSLRIEFKR